MKFALVNGLRQAAQPKLAGVCQGCENPVIARCGEVRAWHWAHKGKLECDPWWENETDWHRNWKNNFPETWQEVVHHSSSGEKHIADVKTAHGWAIEFQHSRIDPEERRSREGFYGKLMWVVDGVRRKRDIEQFSLAWREGVFGHNKQGVKTLSVDKCALLKEWSASSVQVFLDFGIPENLWWIHSKNPDGTVNVVVFSRAEFIAIHCGASGSARSFDELIWPKRRQAVVVSRDALALLVSATRPPVRRRASRRF